MEKEPENMFAFQLELLKKELDQLNTSIDKIDTITQNVKYWTIVLWGGAIALAIENKSGGFKGAYLATAVIPVLFWLVDGWYRRIQRGFIFRMVQISRFLNSDNLQRSFEAQKLTGIWLFDLRGRMSGDRAEMIKFTGITKTLFFPSVGVFYWALIIFSVLVHFLLSSAVAVT